MTRRTQTLLFTDIVGSTEQLAALAPLEADRRRRAHFKTLREQIDRRGGREVKNLGDGLMAAFDAAGHALDCAVAIQQALARTNSAARGDRTTIRIGVSSGDIQIEDGDCFGMAVIEASRLCSLAAGGQVLFSGTTRLLAPDHAPVRAIGDVELRGLPGPTGVWEAQWSQATATPVRAVIADDAALMREGIVHVLEDDGIEVVGQAQDAKELLQLTAALRPDIAIVDIRMPPTYKTEGLDAATQIRAEHPGTAVLLLTMDVEPRYATRLLAASRTSVGYLLKERVSDIREFAAAARRVAQGGTAFEPALLPPLANNNTEQEIAEEVA